MKTFAAAVAMIALIATPVLAQNANKRAPAPRAQVQQPQQPIVNAWCQGRHDPRNPYICNYMPGSSE